MCVEGVWGREPPRVYVGAVRLPGGCAGRAGGQGGSHAGGREPRAVGCGAGVGCGCGALAAGNALVRAAALRRTSRGEEGDPSPLREASCRVAALVAGVPEVWAQVGAVLEQEEGVTSETPPGRPGPWCC